MKVCKNILEIFIKAMWRLFRADKTDTVMRFFIKVGPSFSKKTKNKKKASMIDFVNSLNAKVLIT